jgi:hypothetical protein
MKMDEVMQMDLLSAVKFQPTFVGLNRARVQDLFYFKPWKKNLTANIFYFQ